MSVSAPNPAHAMQGPAAAPPAPRRNYSQQVLHDTFSRVGARVGLIWIGVVAVLAVAAPFVANSHPYVLQRGGTTEFPLFRYLTRADLFAIVAGVTILGLAVFARRLRFSIKVAICLAALIVATPLIRLHIEQETPTYSVFREDQQLGTIQNVLRAPIAFSPSDRMFEASARMEHLPPSFQHWFGTTPDREDVLSRMIHACRVAILIGFISTGIAVFVGCVIGGLMGYFAGWVDIFGMRLIEIFEAIPTLFLLITFVAFYGRDLYIMMAIIGLTTWPSNARFIRAQFLQLRKQDFVAAATALGLPLRSILFRHMLPNGIAPVLVTASFGVASAILSEATLSFLGLGPVDQPSWGTMLNQSRGVGTSFHWWLAVFPGVAIFLTVFSYNLIGEAFRDALDPKLRKRE